MTESDDMCHSWRHGARCTDLLVAPSNYCLDTFRRVVREVPSALLPIPVDERLWLPEEYKEHVPGSPPFLFLSVFHTSERKQWRKLIQAFAEEFYRESETVGLVVKPTRTAEVGELISSCQHMGAWIHMDCEERTDWTLAALYRACDVVVQPSSEGFGLPFVEGALLGKPSVALGLGGAKDIVTEETGYVVPGCTMEPMIGHMPHNYPRTHRFATCDIDALRATMRRAYEEETGGRSKGTAARVNALNSFTPAALAPRFREVIEEGIDQDRLHKSVSRRFFGPFLRSCNKPRWATAFGAWGDVFAACGKIRAVMAEHDLSEIGVIFYGSDKKITAWLVAQPWVREVVEVIEPDKQTMTLNFGVACQARGYHSCQWMRKILVDRPMFASHGVDQIVFTHLRLNEREMPTYWHGAVLAEEAQEWAREKAEQIGKPFYLLNPLSVASNKMRDHWRYWSEAIQWLLERTDETYALVSEKPVEWPLHRNLVNLTGQSRTMEDVLALAELAKGAISTSNNLGIYAPIAGIPCVIVCARTCGAATFYHRWMEIDGIRLLEFEDAMPQFEAAVADLFLGRIKYGDGNIAGSNGHGPAADTGRPAFRGAGRAREREGGAVG